MIHMVTGKPRAGKSYFMLRVILSELVSGHRVVVTNLAIKQGELAAYIAKKYPKSDVDLLKRLRLLTDEETRRFWLYRRPEMPGDEGRVDGVSAADEKAGRFPSWPEKYRSVLYVIDETHIHFDSRRWQEAGHSLTFYDSQHGKLDDTVYFVTQFLDLVDKRVKGFAQDYIYVVNQGLRRILSVFSAPSYMVAKAYGQPVTPGREEFAEWVTRYTLDPDLKNCYDTSQGVGIKGVGAPEVKERKGIPVLVLAAIAVCVIGWVAFNTYSRYFAVTDREHSQAAPLNLTNAIKAVPAALETDSKPPAEEKPPYVTSVVESGQKAIVTLSNGREMTRRTGLRRIEPDYVEDTKGVRYPRLRKLPVQTREDWSPRRGDRS